MQVLIRQAAAEDWAGIRLVRDGTWADDPCDPALIRRVLGDPAHVLYVAEENGGIGGFVDGFITRSATGVLRWEVDLLAVHPDYRGKGMGKALIQASVAAGKRMGCTLARALVKEDNLSSQRVFSCSGFSVDADDHALYIAGTTEDAVDAVDAPLQEGFFIRVDTINYRGLWLENIFTANAFQNALWQVGQEGLDVAGAVLQCADRHAIQHAALSGYAPAGIYQWWYIGL